MSKSIAFFTVNYDDSKQSSYKAFVVSYELGEKEVVVRFETGNAIVDYIDYLLWRGSEETIKNIYSVTRSSSFNHFLMDGNRYKEMYVRHYLEDDKDMFVEVSDKELDKLGFDYSDLTMYITKYPYDTFEKLREYYYKSKKKLTEQV